MIEKIKKVFAAEGIYNVGMIPISECSIINQRILPDFAKSAIVFTIPYRSYKGVVSDGFSEYARIYDYHKFAYALYERIIPAICGAAGCRASGFCDHSPINEKIAAAKCGLGVIGRNSLFIDNRHGSFVFIGSVMTDIEYSGEIVEPVLCINCGRCAISCPGNAIGEHGIDPSKCLSAISQKKQKTDEEKAILREHGIAWGCDVCQNVCPYNEKSEISPIPYFSETRIEKIDRAFIDSLTDEEFKKYAFSYKGRKIVEDNIENLT
ncbi:MAG: epoxyqueuosine reductase [Clostridia bacterium]|nr:epoxyqueuosine reductase [Clostridia bacterium]